MTRNQFAGTLYRTTINEGDSEMTEVQIERHVETIMDLLDARLMSGCLSYSEYNQEVQRLREWADRQYDALGTAELHDEAAQ
jgi:hypothetical protein